ncbi:MAG: NAD(P)-dependent oxidoreductase [Candidatus Latescibacterota bacterium]|jgi:nucleoside-diphosphate-sugar epimerase
MNVLITGAAGRLAQAIAAALVPEHRLRLIDRVPMTPPERTEFMQADLLDPDAMWRAMRGMQAVIHTATPPPDLPEPGLARDQELLELNSRGTHVLLSAAVDAGVRRCVYAGTLALFREYPQDVYISEHWRPLPSLEMAEMSNYMGELICREFARERRLTATALRLGTLVDEDETEGQPPDPAWLDYRDAAQAFVCALKREASDEVHWMRRWTMVHVGADVPNPRFLIEQARHLGYRPVHNFARHWPAREG